MNARNKDQIHLQRYTWDTLPPNSAGTSTLPGSSTFLPTQGRTMTQSLPHSATPSPGTYLIDLGTKLDALTPFRHLLNEIASLFPGTYLSDISDKLGALADLHRLLGEIVSLAPESYLSDISDKLAVLTPFSRRLLDAVASLPPDPYSIDVRRKLKALVAFRQLLDAVASLPTDPYLLNIRTELGGLADLHRLLGEIVSVLSNHYLIEINRKLDELAPFNRLLDEVASLLSNHSLIDINRKLDILTELRSLMDEIVPHDSYVTGRKLNELLLSLPRNPYLINRSGKLNDLKNYSRKLEEEIAEQKKLLEKSKSVVKRTTPPNKVLSHPSVAIVLFIVFCLLLANLVKPDLYSFISNSCSSGSISINASVSMNPLLEQAKADYHKQCSDATINIIPGQPSYDNWLSSGGQESLISLENNQVNIASIDTFADQNQMVTDNQTTIVIYAFVINNQDIGLTNLTTQQIRDIYINGVNNWTDIESRTTPLLITGVSYPATAEISNIFEKYILRDNDAFPGPPGLTSNTPEMALQNVCQIPGAITYVPLYYAKSFLASHRSNVCSLRILSIDNRDPLDTNVTNNSYKFWSLEHLYTKGNATGLTKAFIDHMLMLSDPKNGYLGAGGVPYAILNCHEKEAC